MVICPTYSLGVLSSYINSIAKDTANLIDKLIDLSEEYWLGTDKDTYAYETLSLSIVQRIVTKSVILEQYNFRIDNRYITRLRQALTLRAKSTVTDENKIQFGSIVSASNDINVYLDEKLKSQNTSKFSDLIDDYPNKTGLVLGLVILLLIFSLFKLL